MNGCKKSNYLLKHCFENVNITLFMFCYRFNMNCGLSITGNICVSKCRLSEKWIICCRLQLFAEERLEFCLTLGILKCKMVNVDPVAKKCQCCKMITPAGTVKSSSRATVRLRQNTDCTTENVVYLLSCSSCNKQYEGGNKGPSNKRMNGHRDDWRHHRFERSPTAVHFHSADHDFLSHASVCCLEHNKEWSDSTRTLRESYWIRRLNTLCPFGINKGD